MSFFSELQRRNVFRVAIAYSVVAWLVAQVAELAFDSFGTPDWAMKTLLFMLVMGLPLAVIFAWAFEMTPEGLKREKDVDRSRSITDQTGRTLNYTIIAVLVVALVLSLVTRDWSSETPGDAPTIATVDDGKSIAVLPFVNMSDDKDNEYFSDGISEELLNVLVKVEGLRVASRTSSFSFKGKDTPIPEIADALNVEHVLEGSVRKAGDTVRVTAQLIDVKTDSHLWSETYDRKLEDIFVIQDEISGHIVEALKVALGAGEIVETASKPTENLEAYEDYLKGRYFWQRRGGQNIRKAIRLFEKATAADPGFARAWSSLAAAHITMPTYSGEANELHFPLGLKYANQALALDPTLAEAHAVIGDIQRVEKDWKSAESHYLRAIALEPKNPTGYLWYSEHLLSVGLIQEGLEMAKQAHDLDPLHPGTTSMLGGFYELIGDRKNGGRLIATAWELGHPGAPWMMLEAYISRRDFERAEQFLSENSTVFGEDDVEWARLAIDTYRNPDKSDEYYAHILEFADEMGPHNLVVEFARFGRLDEAFELANKGVSNGNDWGDYWSTPTEFRSDPRFSKLVESVGLVSYWDEFGWSPFCSRDGENIACR